MIKMVILDQSKPIYLIFEEKKSKFQKPLFVHLFIKTEIRQVYNPY